MIVDGRLVPTGTIIRGDVCVVGGGPAGISVALRLARRSKLDVVLLESGGLDFDESLQRLARGTTSGLEYFPLDESRVRILGGSSISWGGICSPLDREAFDRRPWVEGGGWPFGPDALEPWLDDAMALCGIDASARRSTEEAAWQRFREAGLDEDCVAPFPINFSRPTRFGRAYRPELEASPSIRLHHHSTVTRIDMTEDGNRVAGLTVKTLDGGSFRCEARAYVLAAGGIDTPRLMLASRDVRPAGVGNERDQVGRYFMEHPRVLNRYRVRRGDTRLGRLVGGGASGTLRFARLAIAPAAQEREQLLTYNANLSFGYEGQLTPQWAAARRIGIVLRSPWNESPLFQDAGGGRAGIRAADILTILRRPDRALVSVYGGLSEDRSFRRFLEIHSTSEQVPDPSNRVELSSERDELGVPLPHVRWTVGEAEERTYRRGLAMLLGEFERLERGISSRELPEPDPWPDQIEGTWHHVGTARMSEDPARGVVDADCRVHGVPNLYVGGSAVFPTSGSASPTITILQLGLRLADHLERELA